MIVNLYFNIFNTFFPTLFPYPLAAARPHGYVRHFGCKINAVAFVAL